MRNLIFIITFLFCLTLTQQSIAYEYKSMIATQGALLLMVESKPQPNGAISPKPPKVICEDGVCPVPVKKATQPSYNRRGFFRR